MLHHFYPIFHLLLNLFATRRDAQVRFLREENRILRSRVPSQHLKLSPEERFRLMTIGKELHHQVNELISIVTFKTYRRWVKELQLGKKPGRVGRPRAITKQVRQIIVKLAKENPGWGYLRIVGELIKLRCVVGKTSVRRILRQEGIYPNPSPLSGSDRHDRPDYMPWPDFVKLHMNTLVACDFFCKSVWTVTGKHQAYVLFFVHVASRKVWCSPATYHPDNAWVKQQARNCLMWLEEQGLEATHLIRDRDAKFTAAFDHIMKTSGIQIVKSPVMAPNANAFAESWVSTVKHECLNHFVCFSLGHLDHILYRYVGFYNRHRPHQGKRNRVLNPTGGLRLAQEQTEPPGKITCHSELGGLLNHYYRKAA